MREEVVRSGALTGYRRLISSLGGDPQVLLAASGLRIAELDNPDRYISYYSFIAALEGAAQKLEVSDLGLQLASFQDISIVGPLAFAMQNAPSAYHGMKLTAQNIAFQSPSIQFEVREEPDSDIDQLVFDIHLAEPVPMDQAIEHAIGVILKALKLLMGERLAVHAVCFRHDRLSPLETYRRHFGIDARFGENWNGVCVDRRAFRSLLPKHSPLLANYARQFVQFRLPSDHLPVDQQTKEVLRHLMRSQPATLSAAARALSIHPRTLQQRLSRVSTTFEKLRDEVRKELADVYLAQNNIPLAHIASLLGYSEQAVFTRSCKRWFGCPPKQRRRDILTKATAKQLQVLGIN
ncbi:MAG: AraC family transcriptional regulator [Alphaproteobacteria bacterium]|nr:MAG: AraC family transcriptional regulator [Alphaproteobacteria bacterium]